MVEFPNETKRGAPIHRYASCLAIDRAEGTVLLVSRSRPGSTSWVIPKAKLDQPEEAELIAQCALWEEAGVEGTMPKLLGVFKETKPEGKTLHWIYELDMTIVTNNYPNPRDRTRHWCTYDDALAAIKAPFLLDAIKLSSISPSDVQAECVATLEEKSKKKKKRAAKKAKKSAKKNEKKKSKLEKKASGETSGFEKDTMMYPPDTNEESLVSSGSIALSFQNSSSETSQASSSRRLPQQQESYDIFSQPSGSDQSTPGTTPGSTEKAKDKQCIKPLPNPKYVPKSAATVEEEKGNLDPTLFPGYSVDTMPGNLNDISVQDQMNSMAISLTANAKQEDQQK